MTLLWPLVLALGGLIVAYLTDSRRSGWLGIPPDQGTHEVIWYGVFVAVGLGLGVLAAWDPVDVVSVLALVALLLTGAYDLRYRLVFPAQVVLLVGAIELAHLVVGPSDVGLRASLAGALAVGLLVLFLYVLAGLLYGFGALGSGDIFVGILIGAALGWPLAVLGVLLGALLGGVAALVGLLAGLGRRGYIPYGAILCLGAALTLSGRWIWQQVPPIAEWLTNLDLLMRLVERSILG